MGRLDAASALVTGGTAGIGLAIARRFVAEGARVMVTGRAQDTLDAAVADLRRLAGSTGGTGAAPAPGTGLAPGVVGDRVLGVRGDVADLADLDAVTAAVAAAGWTLDVLVANAGGGSEEPLAAMTPGAFDDVAGLNVRGTFFTVQKALPLLADGARVVLVSSISGSNGDPGHSVYNASKAAVRSFARTMTSELRDRRIRVNALSPGPTMSRGFSAYVGGPAAVERIAAQVPVGRVGRPEEVAAAALFLATDESSFVAGAELVVDGGLSQV